MICKNCGKNPCIEITDDTTKLLKNGKTVCIKCGQPLDYKYYKQVMRCYNCDFNRIPLACSDVIP